jgi:nitric oxide reductase NorE protein
MSAQDCDAQDEAQGGGWGLLGELPGDPMIWVLIFSELAVFGLLLGAFAIARAINPSVFASGQAVLDPGLAGLNTVVLVTSGWAAARGAAAARLREARACRRWLLLTIGLGCAFVTIKLVEYTSEIATGAGLETSTFFTLYFLLTGFHLLHVVLGMVILAVVWRSAEADAVETGTSFWHMVDLVWVVMFPIIYLVR